MLNQLTVLGCISLINCLTCIFIAIFLFSKNNKSPINISYAIFNICIAIYAFFYFLWQSSNDHNLGVIFFKFCIFGVVLINSAFVHFTFVILDLHRKYSKRLIFVHFINAFFCYASANLFYSSWIVKYNYGLWPVPSNTFNAYLTWWFFQVFYCFYLLYAKGLLKSTNETHVQFKWIFWTTLIAYSGGATNWLVWYNINFPPYLNSGIAVYTVILTYAIFKYQLLGIEVIIRRAAVFAGLFAFVYGVFSTVTIAGQEIFKSLLGGNQWLALIPTVIIITFSLKPLENLLTNATEKILFQKKYDYKELLRTFTNEILTVLDLQKLMDQTVAGLIKIIKLESASVLLLDKEQKIYKLVTSTGVKDKGLVFKPEDVVISYLKQTHQPIQRDKSVDKMEGSSQLREDFKRLNARLCLPVILHDELIGVLCLGMKKSGEDFTVEDIDILLTLARTEAIAISNAQLFDELSKTQAEAAQREKMAVIGTLAAGINHEICNPLGIVRGQCEMFLLNLRDGIYQDKTQQEMTKISADIMAKVIKETDRATSITKKLSSFAKPSKLSELEIVKVESEIDEVIGLIGHDLKLSNIAFSKVFPDNFPAIRVDRKQMQEVLFNIIRNAAQAMDKKEGKIVVSGLTENGSTLIKISDNGSGIPQDRLAQVFHPFYTTKDPGKGTGLGLFIVKQVVEKNKGNIEVESQQGVGTTFLLRFPAVAQLAVAHN